MKHYGRKVKLDGYTFDSVKEASFYAAYIKNSGKEYAVHPQYEQKSRSNPTVDGLTVDQAMRVVRDAVAQILYGESEDDVIVEARADLETLLEQR